MSAVSAVCDSLMNTAQVVCIDHSDNRPSLTPERRTKAITVSVRSTSSIRSLVSTSMVSATTVKPPALTDVVFATGVSLTVTTELLLIETILFATCNSSEGTPGTSGTLGTTGTLGVLSEQPTRLGQEGKLGVKPTRSRHCKRGARARFFRARGPEGLRA